MLAGRQLCVEIGGRKILNSVSLEVRPGRAMILLGPNGAGKTSLLHCLAMLAPPSHGVITWDEESYSFPTARPFTGIAWPRVTVCFQQLHLWPHLTQRETLRLVRVNRATSLITDEDLARYTEQLGLTDLLDRRPAELSLGQRQRFGVLRAITCSPRYLLGDEVSAALDIEATLTVQTILAELKLKGVGLLLISHQLGFASALADDVAFLDNGQLVEQGGREMLLSPQSELARRFLSLVKVQAA